MSVRTPNCPGCEQPPLMVVGVQGFCGNDACAVFVWSRNIGLEEMTAQVLQVKPVPRPDDGGQS